MQLHSWNDHEHPNLGDPDAAPHGYGVLLWFQIDEFDAAIERARALRAEILDGPLVNANAQQRELWLRDPDGYVIVLASAQGDVAQ